ncbi:MAG: cysteine desulfurase [SAR202 cluster bacterium]|nr:MAG: cysteine desulfurase [SAR202 cluster bacterium]
MNIDQIRNDFPILSRKINGHELVYLDNAATTHKPRSVINSLVDFYENHNSNVHRGVHTLSMEATDKFEEAREKISKFINSQTSQSIIWTRNASESLNIISYSWGNKNIGEGDEILLSPMEHHSNLIPWQELARTKGAKIKFLSLNIDGTLDLSNIDELITQKTKLVSIVHVSNALGTINPVKELCEKAHQVGALFVLDGAQSVPHMSVDVQDIGCDFFVFSGHKMMGPTGIGVLYGKMEILEEMDPVFTGGEMVLEVTYEKASWADIPMRFEAGTPNIADSIALGTAVDYLQNIGMENIHDYEKNITSYALKKFNTLESEGVTLFGPKSSDQKGAVFSFHIPNIHPHDLGTILDGMGIAVRTGHHCAMPLIKSLGVSATARASFYVYNTMKEVDTLIDGIKSAIRYFGDGSN